MREPIVSVVIPTYNRSAYLKEAVESVLAQSYINTEIIVVDDGSTDDTHSVIKSYNGRVIYIKQENNGPSSARNRGISIASGVFIAFLDSDDLWHRDKLEKQLGLFEKNDNIGLVASGHDVINNRSELINRYILGSSELHQLKNKQLYKNFFSTPSVIVRKTCFDNAGLFNENLCFAEDWDMWLRILRISDVGIVNEPLVIIREHSESLTREFSDRNLSDWELVVTEHCIGMEGFFDTLKQKRYSWFYWNKANIFRNKGRKAIDYLIRSILLWPFGHRRRYLQLLKWLCTRPPELSSKSSVRRA